MLSLSLKAYEWNLGFFYVSENATHTSLLISSESKLSVVEVELAWTAAVRNSAFLPEYREGAI